MNKKISAIVIFVVVPMVLAGCGHKTPDTDCQIKAAVQAMAQVKSASLIPGQQLNEAVTAYQNGNYQDAVTKLQTIRSHTEMTGEQLMALNQAITAVMNDLYVRATKGDDQAKAAITEYERLKNIR